MLISTSVFGISCVCVCVCVRIRSVDNSDYMRNGDFVPTRLQAQQDAVHVVCQSKTRSNPENNVGLLTLAKYVLELAFL